MYVSEAWLFYPDASFFDQRRVERDQVELPYENNEMCIESVQVALQVQCHCLFKVRPVEVSQHMEQVAADLLHQGVKGVGEFFAWGKSETVRKGKNFADVHALPLCQQLEGKESNLAFFALFEWQTTTEAAEGSSTFGTTRR